jgi:NO-binding membrane sensor protein with MHYT domain
MDAPPAPAMAVNAPRNLVCHYNPSIVAAALVVSLLGAFTSTQLMSQARVTRAPAAVLIWTVLGCLVFGFCATWCLHFLGMLSCEFDVPIGLNPTLTVLSAVLAVSFTFGALSSDFIQEYLRPPRPNRSDIGRHQHALANNHLTSDLEFQQSSEPLLPPSIEPPPASTRKHAARAAVNGLRESTVAVHSQNETSSTDALLAGTGIAHLAAQRREGIRTNGDTGRSMTPSSSNLDQGNYDGAYMDDTRSASESPSRFSLDNTHPRVDTAAVNGSRRNSFYEPSRTPDSNTLLFAARAIFEGLTLANVTKGFVWSIALTNMHFMGVKALDIPGGFVALNPARVILCALISWSVCCVGVILMAGMEVNIKQQVLFSVVAATGVAAVHFSGLLKCTESGHVRS